MVGGCFAGFCGKYSPVYVHFSDGMENRRRLDRMFG